jgi:hypothetical protein
MSTGIDAWGRLPIAALRSGGRLRTGAGRRLLKADVVWYEKLNLLDAFVREFGHLPPATENGVYQGVNLGHWIYDQRKAMKGKNKGKMTLDRIEALEQVPGWYW